MKQILLLFDTVAIEQELADPERLVSLMMRTNKNINVRWVRWEDLIFYISNNEASISFLGGSSDLADFDSVYFRRAQLNTDLRLAAAIYLRKKGVPFVDTEAYQPKGSINKLTQYFRYWEHGLPIPSTFFGLDEQNISTLAHKGLKYPFIVKSLAGTRGQDNHFVSSKRNLLDLVKNKEARYLVQEFIPNDCDYRILVMGGKPVMAIKRTRASGVHLNNTSQGAQADLVDVSEFPTTLLKDIVSSVDALGRNIAGVDVVVDSVTKKHYLFEVNRSPQIENSTFELEKASHLSEYLERISR